MRWMYRNFLGQLEFYEYIRWVHIFYPPCQSSAALGSNTYMLRLQSCFCVLLWVCRYLEKLFEELLRSSSIIIEWNIINVTLYLKYNKNWILDSSWNFDCLFYRCWRLTDGGTITCMYCFPSVSHHPLCWSQPYLSNIILLTGCQQRWFFYY